MSKLLIKTYVVLQEMNVPTREGHTLRVVDVCLTRAKAEDIKDATPGTFIERHVASK